MTAKQNKTKQNNNNNNKLQQTQSQMLVCQFLLIFVDFDHSCGE